MLAADAVPTLLPDFCRPLCQKSARKYPRGNFFSVKLGHDAKNQLLSLIAFRTEWQLHAGECGGFLSVVIAVSPSVMVSTTLS